MENISFYPTLTPELSEASGVSCGDYHFSYQYEGSTYEMIQEVKKTVKLIDPLNDVWRAEKNGLTLSKTVSIAYPHLLKGEHGIICEEAELGLCIFWTSKKLTQTGIILPTSFTNDREGITCSFIYTFEPGMLSGDLELSLSMYVKTAAENVSEEEKNLINEAGVTIGEIEQYVLDFNNLNMEFPIEEVNSESEPLWWIEISDWEDPKTIDMFSKDSFCLYLNTYYAGCPKLSINGNSSSVKNLDLLIDILAQSYLLLFTRLTEEDLKATTQGIGLANNSVCSILHEFYDRGQDLQWDWFRPEKLLKTLHLNIRKMLQEES